MLRFLRLPERFVVQEFKKNISTALQQEIARIWDRETAVRGPRLFNGPLFSVEQLSADVVIGRFIEYRLFLAQLRRPELFSELRVQPLAVTGLLQNKEGLFFGLRSPGVAQQPDCWELVPAGGIDAGTLTQEEVGLKTTEVSPPRLVCFCEDLDHHIFDLVWDLETTLDTKTIMAAHATIDHPEHASILCVPWRDLNGFLAGDHRAIVAGNRDLLSHIAGDKRWMHLAK
jgi:hypothetical protein